ncbi:MAG: BspA family leucine-rich repeat surface protein [Prevotella sp.]|nr:BspA family leucine-rich repeat surface protein [Prevotella sp.]
MNIKTKSIITLCLTALASMPLSAQSYFGSVVDIDGTYTTAKNIKVEANQVVFTDHKDATHTIASNHGYSTPVKVIHDVLYCENDETMNSELVNKAVKTGQLTLSGTLNNHNWSLLNEGKLNGITSAHFHNVIGDEAFTALSNLKCSSLSYVTFEDCSFPNVTSLERLLYGSAITSFTWGGMNVSGNLNTLSYMFHDCQSLQSVSLKGLNTNNVTSLNNLFYNCKNLSNIDLTQV